MAVKPHKCTACGKSFSMAAHWARHRNSAHNAKRAGRPPRRGATNGASFNGNGMSFAHDVVGQAHSAKAGLVMDELNALRNDLLAQREAIEEEIVRVDDALGIMGESSAVLAPSTSRPARAARTATRGRPGRPAGKRGPGRPPKHAASAASSATGRKRGPGRPKGSTKEGSLPDVIVKVLAASKKPLSPKQISAAAKKRGYKTKAKDLSKAVSNALPNITKVKKAKFGMYEIK